MEDNRQKTPDIQEPTTNHNNVVSRKMQVLYQSNRIGVWPNRDESQLAFGQIDARTRRLGGRRQELLRSDFANTNSYSLWQLNIELLEQRCPQSRGMK